MAPAKELARLALQKRILLAESEARRLVLAIELSRLIRPVRWIDRFKIQARPLLLTLSTGLTYLFVRRSRGPTRWVATLLGASRLYRGLRHYLSGAKGG